MRERLDIIQAWRGFAALAVVVYHAVEVVARSGPEGAMPAAVVKAAWVGNFGVDIFFVISGFIMIYAHHDDFGLPGSPGQFLSDRLKRIVPNYWLLTTLGVIALLVMPGLSQYGRTFDLDWILASYLFVPWTSDAGIPLPVLGLGWTLNYEMYFYLMFSIALLFPKHRGLMLLTAVFSVSIVAGMVLDLEGPLFKQVTSWLLAEFLLGVPVGLAFKSGRRIPTSLALLLLALVLPVLIASFAFRANGTLPTHLRFVFFGLPAAAIIAASIMSFRIRSLQIPATILLLGNASYALYLTHVFTLPLVAKVLSTLGASLPFYLHVLVSVFASAGVAIVFYKLFERPLHARLRRVESATAI